MASVKELYAKALGYTLYEIQEVKDLIAETEETISYLTQGTRQEQAIKARYIKQRNNELTELKNELHRLEKIFKADVKMYGYTEEEIKKLVTIPTAEQLEKEYQQEVKQAEKEAQAEQYKYETLINLVAEWDKTHPQTREGNNKADILNFKLV